MRTITSPSSPVHAAVLSHGIPLNVSTVYRTFDRLEELGIIHRLDVRGTAVYRTAPDPHHHAVCGACDKVMDLAPDDANAALTVLSDQPGLHPVGDFGLTVRVTCDDCRSDPAMAQRPELAVSLAQVAGAATT